MKNNLKVENLEGELEPFSSQKVYQSAKNAGADKETAEKITKEIEKQAYDQIKTENIFKEIKKLLKKEDFPTSLRFDLKKAIKRLGPTGFPFEKYIKSILEKQGFKTKINLYIKGKCCTYEIDFLAEKEKTIYIGECKYRNLFESSVDINFALINYARFLDVKKNKSFKNFSKIKSILVTNGKLTKKAIQYSECIGEDLLGWKYPKNNGLEKIIEKNYLYPITILPSLSGEIEKALILQKKMLVKDILNLNLLNFSKRNKISIKKLEKLKQEAEILIKDENFRQSKK